MVVGVGEFLEPGDGAGGLADFVGNLPVFPLVVGQEAEALCHQLPLAGGVHGKGIDGCVSAEEPAEPRPEAGAGGAPPRHQPAPQIGVAGALFLQVHLGPLQGTGEGGTGVGRSSTGWVEGLRRLHRHPARRPQGEAQMAARVPTAPTYSPGRAGP